MVAGRRTDSRAANTAFDRSWAGTARLVGPAVLAAVVAAIEDSEGLGVVARSLCVLRTSLRTPGRGCDKPTNLAGSGRDDRQREPRPGFHDYFQASESRDHHVHGGDTLQ